MGRKQGENVALGFVSSAPAQANQIVIYDANGNVRTLQPWERLIVDVIGFDTQFSDTTNLAFVVASPAGTTPAALPMGEIVATFTANQGIPGQGMIFPAEGQSQPVGYVLWLLLVGDGWSTSETALTGSARIVNGTTQGTHPRWEALLTPGGNTNGA
jgi:hypothetical protein